MMTKAQTYEVLINNNMSWNGVPVEFPRGNNERIVSKMVHIPKGKALPWHKHEVQVMGHVISGELTIEDVLGNRKVYSAGQSFIEGNELPHRGLATGKEDVKVVAFYLVVDDKMEFVPIASKSESQ